MRDAVDSAAMIRAHRNDEAIVSQGHELILDCIARATHQAFQRTRDVRTEPRQFTPNARQLRTGAIVKIAVGQNLFSDQRV